MIIYLVSRSGSSSEFRIQVRDWKRGLTIASTMGFYIDGVGFERPFNEFAKDFLDRRSAIFSLFMSLNTALRERDKRAGVLPSLKEVDANSLERLRSYGGTVS